MAYKRFDPEDIVLSSENVTTPAWSNGRIDILGPASGSSESELAVDERQTVNPASSNYYRDYIYNDPSLGPDDPKEIQFSLTYADVSGSLEDAAKFEGIDKSRAIYGQYRSLVLGDENSDFKFNEDVVSERFIAMTVERARFKERFMLGSFKLKLKVSDAETLELEDNSADINSIKYIDSGRVYNLVKANRGQDLTKIESYGWLLPDIGVILFDGEKCGLLERESGSIEIINNFFERIYSIELGAEETVTSTYIFARARNSEFNYSINPSFTGKFGELTWDVMVNSPQVYITAVGLYNDAGDLLAVAKLSRPLLKDFTKEALIRIKLDY